MFEDESEVGRKLIECKNVSDREGGAGNGAVGRSSRGRSSNPDNSSKYSLHYRRRGGSHSGKSGKRTQLHSYTDDTLLPIILGNEQAIQMIK